MSYEMLNLKCTTGFWPNVRKLYLSFLIPYLSMILLIISLVYAMLAPDSVAVVLMAKSKSISGNKILSVMTKTRTIKEKTVTRYVYKTYMIKAER